MRSGSKAILAILALLSNSGSCSHAALGDTADTETEAAGRLTLLEHRQGTGFQKPLRPAAKASENLFVRKPQVENLCPSFGESQWTGTVTVADGHDLFYWLFNSRNDPQNDPIIISMAGGPGASSLLNMLRGTGPCALDGDASRPRPNPWSWNNHASLLFIDQPAGTGFSEIESDVPLPKTEKETAKDFQRFLNIFFAQAFPEKQHLPIHISTGSYGGHYGPVYLDHILQSRRSRLEEAFWGNITSLILPDAVIDWTGVFLGVHPLLCEGPHQPDILNATECDLIAKSLPEQKRLGRQCQDAYFGDKCKFAFDHGVKFIHSPYMDHRRSLANIREKCPDDEYPFCKLPAIDHVEKYLNQDFVKRQLDVPEEYHFRDVNMDIWQAFHDSGAWYAPTTKELIAVLDAHAEQEKVADIKVLVLNGNLDFYVNSPGNMWQYDRLGWRGQDDYRNRKFQPLPDDLGATGSWKATMDGRLAFVAIDEAGHFMPRSAREGYYRIVQKWIQNGWRG